MITADFQGCEPVLRQETEVPRQLEIVGEFRERAERDVQEALELAGAASRAPFSDVRGR